MSDFPIRMRASLDGDTALVKALLTHPMETGFSKDTEGQLRPAHFITEVDLLLNGVLVARVQTGAGISADPLFGWRVTGVRPGDKISVVWRDNQGQQQAFETTAQ
ncbi:MAG: thiosulfate oxidation carrier complex protein SoxZ [Candidatus Contendobacter sp.]|jgi:sulfur-oxidizing protein SoxZ|nr:thiosulfate oxidation carrier complex protein SoxZ [Candidatus Contendobacter sp.]